MSFPEELALTVKEARQVARRTAQVVASDPIDQAALEWTIDDIICETILDACLGPCRGTLDPPMGHMQGGEWSVRRPLREK